MTAKEITRVAATLPAKVEIATRDKNGVAIRDFVLYSARAAAVSFPQMVKAGMSPVFVNPSTGTALNH